MKKTLIKTFLAATILFSLTSPISSLAANNNSINIENSTTNNISQLDVVEYTYESAPETARIEHEENCASINKTPKADDIIYVMNKNSSPSTNFSNGISLAAARNSGTYAIKNGNIVHFYLLGNCYTVYLNSTYVGYNHTTEGIPVYLLQYLLITKDYDIGIMDGIFGPKTHGALINFQDRKNLSTDGIAGPNTWNAFWN